MTADVSASLAGPEAGRLVLPSYERPEGLHPPLDFDGYRSTALRHPKQPLVLLPHRLTEVTGPLLGDGLITATDSDLTTQHDGEPQGQRIIVTGQVLDSGGRPVPIHFSLFGRAFTQRVVTQMYFPGDPLLPLDPVFNSVPDEKARQGLIADFDIELTQPEWALGYHWDVVLRGRDATLFE